jgi:hypothetical protein
LVILASVFVLVLLASQPASAASGQCVTARVDGPFRLPDGLLYPAGTLSLCDGGAYSPVADFQRILVEGSSIGLFVSNRRRAEQRGMMPPQVQFDRGSDGTLALVGYTLPSSGRSTAFRMKRQHESWLAHRRLDGASAAPVAAIIAASDVP